MPRCLHFLRPFSDRFLLHFCSQLRPSWSCKTSPRCSESAFREKTSFEVDIDFWFHFGANLAPFWQPKSVKIRLKPTKIGRRWAKMAPKWAKMGPRWAKIGPTWAKMRPRWGQDGPRRVYVGSYFAYVARELHFSKNGFSPRRERHFGAPEATVDLYLAYFPSCSFQQYTKYWIWCYEKIGLNRNLFVLMCVGV